MFAGAIPARAGRQPAKKINLGKKFQMVAGAHRAGLHEILAGVARKAGTHEHIQNVMHHALDIANRQPGLRRKGTRQIGMATMMIMPARQKIMGIGIAARANHIMNRSAKRIHAIPAERILDDGGHRAQIGET